ncbi:Crp/Fnr family transcriptional regulator [uncultured Roseobacter sp.]|uniref:Crp/Fnr family transcriptional regulator n=1 Tax=uncultured Roseobacter sp. TaxID=114847 RepID=UPI002607077E|nr:Crp/Fnr family transcriptional regulator [uncultured Roseobacter sp.]
MLEELLTALPKSALKTIATKRGDALFRQGQRTHGFFRVVSGGVVLQRMTETGVLVIHRAAEGDYFAEASIFSDAYHCDAVCLSDSTVVCHDRGITLELMRAGSDFSMQLSQHLANQVQQYRAHSEILAIRSAKHRVLAAVQAGYHQGTVTELAGRINLTHEACYRALTELCGEDTLQRVGRGKYVLSERTNGN